MFYKNGFKNNAYDRSNFCNSHDQSLNLLEDEVDKNEKLQKDNKVEDNFDEDLNEEPILNLNIQKNFLSSLIQLFGESSDECHLNGKSIENVESIKQLANFDCFLKDFQDIEIGFKLGHKLYQSWKRTVVNGVKKNSSSDNFFKFYFAINFYL